jgi:hypothetical protein
MEMEMEMEMYKSVVGTPEMRHLGARQIMHLSA